MNETYEIAKLCMNVDINANEMYLKIANLSHFDYLKNFFEEMAAEEATHVSFWKKLIEYLSDLPPYDIFDEAADIIEDLKSAISDSNKLLETLDHTITEEQAFLMAYEMEFYLLHPSFEVLFEYFGYLSDLGSMTDEYDDHIGLFLEHFQSRLNHSLQSKLLAKSLRELWNRNKELVFHNTYDFLTGVLSKKSLLERAEMIILADKRNNKLTTVVMLDLDNFKSINDNFGHLYGDKVLKSFADILLKYFRATDLVGRYGGDEFIIFLSDVDRTDIDNIINKISNRLTTDLVNTQKIEFSFGFSQQKYLGEGVKTFITSLIKSSDNMLYEMKKIKK